MTLHLYTGGISKRNPEKKKKVGNIDNLHGITPYINQAEYIMSEFRNNDQLLPASVKITKNPWFSLISGYTSHIGQRDRPWASMIADDRA